MVACYTLLLLWPCKGDKVEKWNESDQAGAATLSDSSVILDF